MRRRGSQDASTEGVTILVNVLDRAFDARGRRRGQDAAAEGVGLTDLGRRGRATADGIRLLERGAAADGVDVLMNSGRMRRYVNRLGRAGKHGVSGQVAAGAAA